MKQIFPVVVVAAITASATIGIFKYFESAPTPITVPVPKGYAQYAANYEPTNLAPPLTQSDRPLGDATEDFIDAAKRATPAVVHIKGKRQGYSDFWGMGGQASGSGVIVTKDGYILTNNHVVENASSLEVTFNDRRSFEARLVGTDPSTDLAVIKILDEELKEDLTPIVFGNSDEALVGEWVLAVGNPFNLTSTVTAGIISAKGRNIDILEGRYSIESFIQTDAAVNPGNSGGALVDADNGALIGINTAIITRSGRYEGYSFAVPSNLAKKVMDDLVEYGQVQRGFLGVIIKDVTKTIAEENKLPNLNGVYLDKVNAGSAADEGGLQKGDIILKVNSVPVTSSPALQEQIALFRPGNELSIEFIRAGKRQQTKVQLRNGENTTTLSRKRNTERFKEKKNILLDLGIEIRPLSAVEQEKFNTEGVLITKIDEGSIIAGTNMTAMYIVQTVNGQKVTNIETFKQAVFEAKNEVDLSGFYEEYGEYDYSFSKF